jgi:hypothetical protein
MEPPKYLLIAFSNNELPVDLDINNPGAVARRLAQDKFSLAPDELDPSYPGHCGGYDGRGFIFEVQVKSLAAHRIEKMNHPDVRAIFDPMPSNDFSVGALDPKDMPPAVKKKFGGPTV